MSGVEVSLYMTEWKLGVSLALSISFFRRWLVIMPGHIITKFLIEISDYATASPCAFCAYPKMATLAALAAPSINIAFFPVVKTLIR